MNVPVEDELRTTLARFQIELSDQCLQRLDQYRSALWDANTRMNLTRHDDFERFVARDVVDSVQLAGLLQPGESVLDVGSGGGVPGVILAILRPDLRVTCCESVGKKALALSQIVDTTGLPIKVHAERAEKLLQRLRFDSVTARGVGPLPKLLSWFQPHWQRIGRLLLIKGRRWVEERGAARHMGLMRELDLRCLRTYDAPDSGARSVILELRYKIRN